MSDAEDGLYGQCFKCQSLRECYQCFVDLATSLGVLIPPCVL